MPSPASGPRPLHGRPHCCGCRLWHGAARKFHGRRSGDTTDGSHASRGERGGGVAMAPQPAAPPPPAHTALFHLHPRQPGHPPPGAVRSGRRTRALVKPAARRARTAPWWNWRGSRRCSGPASTRQRGGGRGAGAVGPTRPWGSPTTKAPLPRSSTPPPGDAGGEVLVTCRARRRVLLLPARRPLPRAPAHQSKNREHLGPSCGSDEPLHKSGRALSERAVSTAGRHHTAHSV